MGSRVPFGEASTLDAEPEDDREAELRREQALARLFGPLLDGEREQPIARAAASALAMAHHGAGAAAVPTVAGLEVRAMKSRPITAVEVRPEVLDVEVFPAGAGVAAGQAAEIAQPALPVRPAAAVAIPAEPPPPRGPVIARVEAAPPDEVPPKPRATRQHRPTPGVRGGLVAASVVVIIALVVGGTVAMLSAQAQERLAAAVAGLAQAEASIAAPRSDLEAATESHVALAESGTETAAAAAPVLAQLAGMSDEAARTAAQTALDAVEAQARVPLDAAPAAYASAEVDATDLDALAAASAQAEEHRALLSEAADDVRSATARLQDKVDALRTTLLALAATLPASANQIVADSPLPGQELRDAVVAAAGAAAASPDVAGALAAMGTYAAAVPPLRNEQVRIAEEQERQRQLAEERAARERERAREAQEAASDPAPAPEPPAVPGTPTVPIPPIPDPLPEPEPAPEPEPEPEPGPGDDGWTWPWDRP